MMMTVNEFINKKNYSLNAKKGGIVFLISKWDWICSRIPYNSKYNFDEYLNDLSTRRVIGDIIANCEVDEQSINRLEQIDNIFKNKTVDLKDVGFGEFIFCKEWNKNDYWYYYRIPKERLPQWGAYYKESPYYEDK